MKYSNESFRTQHSFIDLGIKRKAELDKLRSQVSYSFVEKEVPVRNEIGNKLLRDETGKIKKEKVSNHITAVMDGVRYALYLDNLLNQRTETMPEHGIGQTTWVDNICKNWLKNRKKKEGHDYEKT